MKYKQNGIGIYKRCLALYLYFFDWSCRLVQVLAKVKKNKHKKLTKPIKPIVKNCTAIGQKTDPKRYASVLIMRKLIPIGSVTNLRKNQADRTAHTLKLLHTKGPPSRTSFYRSIWDPLILLKLNFFAESTVDKMQLDEIVQLDS